jgi:hypothetical protein
MTDTATRPHGVLLVGSVPLENADEVFRAASDVLGSHLKRIPDGETGTRTIWVGWQAEVFASHAAFEVEEPPPGQYAPLPRFRLTHADGATLANLDFPAGIGYADAAKASFERFAELKRNGVMPERMRFQVALPTPLAPMAQFVSQRDQAVVEPAYERQMLREVAEICDAIPHDELAIQWDTAIEMGMWEGMGGLFTAWFEPVQEGIVERLERLGAGVPDDVELGYHFCYGDFGHEHFVQPTDTSNLVDVANRTCDAVQRPIAWVHLPVPRDRTDAAYYAALSELRLHPETELYLGLVHLTDGVDGTEQRIAAAQSAVSDFGVATECGLGRRPADTVRLLLELHGQVADTVG